MRTQLTPEERRNKIVALTKELLPKLVEIFPDSSHIRNCAQYVEDGLDLTNEQVHWVWEAASRSCKKQVYPIW